MKKAIVSLFLAVTLAAGAAGQATAPKTEDLSKKLIRIDKMEPAPDFLKTGFDSITAADSMVFLNFLASDLLEGRETGTRGFDIAAEYAASLFSLWGIKPAGDMAVKNPLSPMAPPAEISKSSSSERSYFQEFAMKEITEVTGEISVDVRTGDAVKSRLFRSGIDYKVLASSSESLTSPVVFAGYGIVEKEIGWDDFKGLDVKGKIVLVLAGTPGRDDPKSPFHKPQLERKYSGGMFDKSAEIMKLGAAAVLQVSDAKDAEFLKGLAAPKAVDDARPIIKDLRRPMLIPGSRDKMPWDSSDVITVTSEMADALLENTGLRISELRDRIDKNFKSASMLLPGTSATIKTSVSSSLVRSSNVIGFVEGSDPVLRNEVIVIGGHLDHLGRHGDYIFNGADDNGSGSVGILNAARAFALSPRKPKRTIVFCLWTGEEKGLLGSRYYVQNPAFPIEKTVACINLDMIGVPFNEKKMKGLAARFNIPADSDFMTKTEPESFMTVPLSDDASLLDILRGADKYVGMTLFPREIPKSMNRMGGSDHAPFAAVGIPWIFFITGGGDDYHQTNDSTDKVSGETIARVSRLIFATAFELADR